MRAIITILALASVCFAQWGPGGIPTDWRGYGIEWMESSKFTTSGATSYLSMVGDTLKVVPFGTASTSRDPMISLFDSYGLPHNIYWDDSANRMVLAGNTNIEGNVYCGGLYQSGSTFALRAGESGYINIETSSARPNFLRDPNTDGQGTIYDGQVGDNDLYVNSCSLSTFQGRVDIDTLTFDSWAALVRYIDADYTATATDWQIVAEDTCRVTLPALTVAFDSLTAATGYGLQLDIFAVTDACTISTVADSIWGNAEIVLTPGDNASLRAGRDFWIIR